MKATLFIYKNIDDNSEKVAKFTAHNVDDIVSKFEIYAVELDDDDPILTQYGISSVPALLVEDIFYYVPEQIMKVLESGQHFLAGEEDYRDYLVSQYDGEVRTIDDEPNDDGPQNNLAAKIDKSNKSKRAVNEKIKGPGKGAPTSKSERATHQSRPDEGAIRVELDDQPNFHDYMKNFMDGNNE